MYNCSCRLRCIPFLEQTTCVDQFVYSHMSFVVYTLNGFQFFVSFKVYTVVGTHDTCRSIVYSHMSFVVYTLKQYIIVRVV